MAVSYQKHNYYFVSVMKFNNNNSQELKKT